MAFHDIRKTRNRLSPEEIRLLGFVVIGIIVLLAANIFLARSLPGGEWLYLRWNGARAFLFEHSEPYSRVIAERVQQFVYGRAAFSSESGYVLSDPLYIVLMYSPLALFSDFSLARGLWMLFAEAALIGSVILAVKLSEWEPPRWLYALLIIFALFNYYSLDTLFSASPSVFLLFLYLSVLLALRSFNDELAGALLLLAAYQWEVGALFFLFIVIAVIAHKRWGVFTGFGMLLFLLLVVSFLLDPGWGLPYIRATLSNWYNRVSLNLNSHLAFWFFYSKFPVASSLAAVMGIAAFLEWIAALRSNFRRIVWAASLSLEVMPLLGFAMFKSNYVVLILPLILVLALAWERWRRRGFISVLVLVIAFATSFVLYALRLSSTERIYSDLQLLLPPAAAIVTLYWMRWQVARTSRPWLERIGARP